MNRMSNKRIAEIEKQRIKYRDHNDPGPLPATSQQALADIFNVGRTTIGAISMRQTWTHLCPQM